MIANLTTDSDLACLIPLERDIWVARFEKSVRTHTVRISTIQASEILSDNSLDMA